MILGYNKQRPTEKNYKDFERKLVRGLSDLEIDGLSLMLYGSYIRGDYNPGRSDIDAVLIFPDNVIINKQNLHRTSIILNDALQGNNISFQVTVTDIATMKDGRFNSYDKSFKEYFDEEARITGTDYREQITYELPTMNEQVPLRFNLRKMRTGLLFAEHDKREDYEAFLTKFNKSLDAVSRGSKQILYIMDGELRKNRFSALRETSNNFSEFNVEPLVHIKDLYHNPKKLDKLYKQPGDMLKLWNSSVTLFEEMIKAYIEKVPKNINSKEDTN